MLKVSFNDYKTILQEIVQKNPEEKVDYYLVSETGPDHDKDFTVQVKLNTNVIGEGKAKSKSKPSKWLLKKHWN